MAVMIEEVKETKEVEDVKETKDPEEVKTAKEAEEEVPSEPSGHPSNQSIQGANTSNRFLNLCLIL